jgi:alanine transaminase
MSRYNQPRKPTSALFDKKTQEFLVKVCKKHSLVLLADDVYMSNLRWPSTHPFTFFKKVVSRLSSLVPLVSFHFIFKGASGESGRGGYFECTIFPEEITGLIYKMVSVSLCPPLVRQIGVDTMLRPPKPGDRFTRLPHA